MEKVYILCQTDIWIWKNLRKKNNFSPQIKEQTVQSQKRKKK